MGGKQRDDALAAVSAERAMMREYIGLQAGDIDLVVDPPLLRSNGLYDVMRYRPRSILRLILLGFGLATLPLVVALITAVFYVEHVTSQTQQTVYDNARSISASQMLVDEISAMERNARQYSILLDPGLYAVYNKRREELLRTMRILKSLPLSADRHAQLDRFSARERQVHELIQDNQPGIAQSTAAIAEFSDLADAARAIQRDSSEQVEKSVTALQEAAQRTQRWLAWQAAAVIPVVSGIVALFIYLITRPISQLDHAIRRLGAGDFTAPISIAGPRDLEDLGHRLQWMGERLLEQENQKLMWLRHMSHELKTPLATLREGTELLNERVVGVLNPQQAEVVELLRDSSIQLQSLIEGLLNFSIYRTIAAPSRGEPVALDEVIEQVLSEQRLVMTAKDLRLTTELMAVTVSGNRDQLRTIVDNLISNAVKYAPEGTGLWLRLSRNGELAAIEVKDEGPGIPPAERRLIFEAFFRGKIQPQGYIKGTGLGLSIAREFARLHRGDIHVIDQEKGALLRVTLPVM